MFTKRPVEGTFIPTAAAAAAAATATATTTTTTTTTRKKKKNLFITNTHNYTSNFRLIHVSDGLPEK